MRTALAVPAAVALLVGTAVPAAADGRLVVSRHEHGFTTLLTGDAFATVDGHDLGRQRFGGVELFLGDGVECFAVEEPPFAYDQRGSRGARMTGTAVLPCGSETAAFDVTVTVELTWTATGPSVRSLGEGGGCVTLRRVAPAAVTGSIAVDAPGTAHDVTLTPSPERPADLSTQVDRCLTGS